MQNEQEIKDRVIALMKLWGLNTENRFSVKLAVSMYESGLLDEKIRKYFEDEIKELN